jgi:hypothetical protein
MSKNITQKIAIIAILLISFFGMNLEESKGQIIPCPAGFLSYPVSELIGGCWYEYEICYKCDPTGNEQVMYLNYVHKLDLSCTGTMNMNQVINYITNKMKSPAFVSSLCTGIAPCSEPSLEVIVHIPICWTKTKIGTGVFYTYCFWDASYCVEQWKMCYDPILDRVVSILVYKGISGDPACSTEPPTPNTGWSDCFYFPDNLCGYED